jgi:hypothetical protein
MSIYFFQFLVKKYKLYNYRAEEGRVWIINNLADEVGFSKGAEKNEKDVANFFREIGFEVMIYLMLVGLPGHACVHPPAIQPSHLPAIL